jgi:hypothetical protein
MLKMEQQVRGSVKPVAVGDRATPLDQQSTGSG